MSISSWLSYIHIGPRIYAGFLSVIAVVVLISTLAYRGAESARVNLSLLEQVRDRATAILELDRTVVTLQSHVENYTHTGHTSLAQRVQADIVEITNQLQTVRNLVQGSTERELLDRMLSHFQVYRDTFVSVVTERALRGQLVRDTTVQTRAAFAADARILREREPDNPHVAALETEMLAATTNLYHYLHDPQYKLLITSKQALESRVNRLEQHAVDSADAETRAVRTRLIDNVRQFQREFTRLVQATRSYLYLVGVVMAGEAQEFRYVSSKLRDSILSTGKPIPDRMAARTAEDQRTATLASIIALLAALFISGLIARSISVPITRMTATFKELAAGENHAIIPETDRRDEIGVMAKAANVFREKNQETQRLLAQEQRLTEELDKHKQELERSNEEMEQFVYTVSHDLKSPIVTSLGFIGMMRKLASKGKLDKAMSKLDTLEKANRRMSQLIEDLLDLSRVGRVDKDLKDLDMNVLLSDLVSSMAKKLEDNRASINIAGPLPSIRANESRVLQVFDNLLGNALKYGANKDGIIDITVGGMLVDNEARLFVRDTGPGIAPEFHERVFGLFQRLQPSSPGTGIGLAIVSRVMGFHRGRVWIESSGADDGACFWLAFPTTTPEKTPREAA